MTAVAQETNRKVVRSADPRQGCTRYLLNPAPRVVHIVAKNLVANREKGTNLPLVGIRRVADLDRHIVVRHVNILGPSTLVHRPELPLPGTDGRAICVMWTDAALEVFVDAGQPVPQWTRVK
jgi:hypothetical protein